MKLYEVDGIRERNKTIIINESTDMNSCKNITLPVGDLHSSFTMVCVPTHLPFTEPHTYMFTNNNNLVHFHANEKLQLRRNRFAKSAS